MRTDQLKIFNQKSTIVEGWYWLARAQTLKRGRPLGTTFMGQELVLFRGEDEQVIALDAYCPHMGAHLAEGKVEGNQLRCFFHRWRFDEHGRCTDIPCLKQPHSSDISTRSWFVREGYGLIWVWAGKQAPTHDLPLVPELEGKPYVASLGNHFKKNCHPNVVMINAIDEQHFRSVHKLPGDMLSMEPTAIDNSRIQFSNIGKIPEHTKLSRFFGSFYQNALFYDLHYWYGSTGVVSFGPDFLHFYLMFTLRQTADGATEGQTIAFTKARNSLLGRILSHVILGFTKLAGRYFAHGDTRVFQTIRFDFKSPIQADRAVVAFIQHLEKQTLAHLEESDQPVRLAQLERKACG